jgi:hypothetical protein
MIEDGAYFKGSIEIDRTASESGADKSGMSRSAAVPVATASANAGVSKSS